MIMYEQDSDVIRWGLDLLNVDPFPSAAYGDPNHQSLATSYSYSPSVATYYQEDYGRDGNAEVVERSIVENDEVIARALQEEFSQLADAEASENPRAEEEHSKASVLAQDWISPVGTNNPGGEATSDNGDNMEPSSSCSSPEVKDGEGDWALELADDYPMLDGEVGKRLNQMVPIRHVPRINGEIPSVHEAISDHQRLLDSSGLYPISFTVLLIITSLYDIKLSISLKLTGRFMKDMFLCNMLNICKKCQEMESGGTM